MTDAQLLAHFIKFRNRYNITGLAEDLGIHRRVLQDWVKGKQALSPKHLPVLIQALKEMNI